MYERSYGAKYDANLTTVQIAAAFRADVKAAVKAGTLPKGLKLSVRCRHRSIDVDVIAYPFEFKNPDFEPVVRPECERFTAQAKAHVETLEGMLWAYNHDGSDIQSDYFDVKFYGHVRFHEEKCTASRSPVAVGA